MPLLSYYHTLTSLSVAQSSVHNTKQFNTSTNTNQMVSQIWWDYRVPISTTWWFGIVRGWVHFCRTHFINLLVRVRNNIKSNYRNPSPLLVGRSEETTDLLRFDVVSVVLPCIDLKLYCAYCWRTWNKTNLAYGWCEFTAWEFPSYINSFLHILKDTRRDRQLCY